MKKHAMQIRRAAMTILVLAAAGCVTKPSPPASFYMVGPLAPAPASVPAETKNPKAMIAVETVRVPAYLDRNQIVTTEDGTQYYLADFNHWAEPLSDSLTRTVAENLSRMLAGESADVFPSARAIPFDYSVNVEVLRLDGRMNDHVTLDARWAIFGPDERDLLHVSKSQYRETVGGNTYKELVTAYSRAVENLCRDVAASLKEVMAGP